MADTLDRDHFEAAMVLLRAEFVGANDPKVYPSVEGYVPPNPPPNYVRVYGFVGNGIELVGNAVDGLAKTYESRYYCHCVGATDAAARATSGRVRFALLNIRPVIAGRNCGPFRDDSGANPPQRDEGTGTTVYDLVRVFRLLTFA